MGVIKFARVKLIGEPRVRHYLGMPPMSDDEPDNRVPLPVASMILLVEDDGDGTYLYRLNEDKEAITDTWHMTVEDAESQAEFEYGVTHQQWEEPPADLVEKFK